MLAICDTSIFIGSESGRLDVVQIPVEAGISTLTVEELWLGVLRAMPDLRHERRETFDLAVHDFDVVPVSQSIARLSAEIRAEGRERGRRYGIADSLIGATGRHLGLPVYTQDAGFEGMAGVDVRVV